MMFHTFGDPGKPAIILLHGELSPWQIWEEAIYALEGQYFLVVPALDGHVEEERTTFLSVEAEAQKNEDFLQKMVSGEAAIVCGLSMGGAIAFELYRRNRCRIQHLILDGAPLTPMPEFLRRLMTREYRQIILKTRQRDQMTIENFQQVFLAAKFLKPFFAIAENLSDDSIENMLESVGSGRKLSGGTEATRILFFYGTRVNEHYSKKSPGALLKRYPGAEVGKLSGFSHGELSIYHQKQLIEVFQNLLS